MSRKIFYTCFDCNEEEPCSLNGLTTGDTKPTKCPLGMSNCRWQSHYTAESLTKEELEKLESK